MTVCPTCSGTFTSSEYSNHSKGCSKQVVTFNFKPRNQKITVKKNVQGSFACYCSDARCPDKKRVYKTIENLKKHMKAVGSYWVGLRKVKISTCMPSVDSQTPFYQNRSEEPIHVQHKQLILQRQVVSSAYMLTNQAIIN